MWGMGLRSSARGRAAGACLLLFALAGKAAAQEDAIAGAIAELLADGDVAAARKTLRQHGDRERVVAAAEAALAGDAPGVRGKANVLTLLAALRRPDLVEKALASPVLSASRARHTSRNARSTRSLEGLLFSRSASPSRRASCTGSYTCAATSSQGPAVLSSATQAAAAWEVTPKSAPSRTRRGRPPSRPSDQVSNGRASRGG